MMTSTPPSKLIDILGESWVELENNSPVVPQQVVPNSILQENRGTPTPLVTAPPFSSVSDEYLRLLKEAQRESNHSSARVSIASSRRDSPRDSPKSPPNSPNTELSNEEDPHLKGYYINKEAEEESRNTDWVWDWSSRPDQAPPKDWKFRHPSPPCGRRSYSIRHAKVGKTSLFSREVLYTLFLTNVISLLLGTGIGVWLSKRTPDGGLIFLPQITVD